VNKEPIGFDIQELKAIGLEAVDDIGPHFVRIEDRNTDDELRDLKEAIGSLESGVVFDTCMTLLKDVIIDFHPFQGLFVDRGV
jgi:hypothetical protein